MWSKKSALSLDKRTTDFGPAANVWGYWYLMWQFVCAAGVGFFSRDFVLNSWSHCLPYPFSFLCLIAWGIHVSKARWSTQSGCAPWVRFWADLIGTLLACWTAFVVCRRRHVRVCVPRRTGAGFFVWGGGNYLRRAAGGLLKLISQFSDFTPTASSLSFLFSHGQALGVACRYLTLWKVSWQQKCDTLIQADLQRSPLLRTNPQLPSSTMRAVLCEHAGTAVNSLWLPSAASNRCKSKWYVGLKRLVATRLRALHKRRILISKAVLIEIRCTSRSENWYLASLHFIFRGSLCARSAPSTSPCTVARVLTFRLKPVCDNINAPAWFLEASPKNNSPPP